MSQPIACLLDASEYAVRREDSARIARQALRSRERIAQGARLTFDASVSAEREIRRLIAAESRCCPFLDFELERHDDTLLLELTGPDEAQPIIAELLA